MTTQLSASTKLPVDIAADRLSWFRQARFGMFIHWGIYSQPAGRWDGGTDSDAWLMLHAKMPDAQYQQYAKQFNPTKFDAKAWASLAAEAGMRYMVVTAKHHDGFCMYDSALTDYNIVKATPYGKDPMKPLAQACREAGMTFCFYYSLPDWHHREFPAPYSNEGWHGNPNPNADLSKYSHYMREQLRELLTNYGPIGILWFDGGGSFKGLDRGELLGAKDMVDMFHAVQPQCLVNDRLGAGADYATFEQEIPRRSRPFEVCMTLNDHWGYNELDQNWKSPTDIVHKLVDIVSKGGNFLLNVGPRGDGSIPEQSVEILRTVGRWVQRNSEAIHETDGVSVIELPVWGRLTQKPGKLFCHVLNWPADQRVRITNLTIPINDAHLLTSPDQRITFTQDAQGTTLQLPAACPDAMGTVICLNVDDNAFPINLGKTNEKDSVSNNTLS